MSFLKEFVKWLSRKFQEIFENFSRSSYVDFSSSCFNHFMNSSTICRRNCYKISPVLIPGNLLRTLQRIPPLSLSIFFATLAVLPNISRVIFHMSIFIKTFFTCWRSMFLLLFFWKSCRILYVSNFIFKIYHEFLSN